MPLTRWPIKAIIEEPEELNLSFNISLLYSPTISNKSFMSSHSVYCGNNSQGIENYGLGLNMFWDRIIDWGVNDSKDIVSG